MIGESDLPQREFFGPEEMSRGKIVVHQRPLHAEPVHTRHKAELVAEYIRQFQLVTKHGTYIDAFAGPQAQDAPETWAARRVLELQPLWLRNFFFYDNDPEQVAMLRELRGRHPDKDIVVTEGDFNIEVDNLLANGPIDDSEATFCLLDQRTFECDWGTVQKLARHKHRWKIELFYFLADWWLDRAFGGRTRNQAPIERWWGGDGWKSFKALDRVQRPVVFAERFRSELGYTYVHPFPIYNAEHHGRLLYYMIHASDHERAPRFMEQAYATVVKRAPLTPEPDLFEP